MKAILVALDFATPNYRLLTDQICCPGLDYCALANARRSKSAGAIEAAGPPVSSIRARA